MARPDRPSHDRAQNGPARSDSGPHRPSVAAISLAWCIAPLSLVAAGAGLVWQGGTAPETFTTVRGDVVALFGEGLYRFDTRFQGAGARGTDLVTLVLAVPLILASAEAFRRGSLRGGLLLLGGMGWFLYAYAGYALGTNAYNELFLVYVALFGASLFGFVAAFRAVERRLNRESTRLPRRATATFLLVSGVGTLAIWLSDPVAALLAGTTPRALGPYTTLFTYGIDLGVLVPALFLAGALILRSAPLGTVIAAPLLVLEALLAPMIAAQSVSQLMAGVAFTPAEIAGPIGVFVVLSGVALGFLLRLLRSVGDGANAAAG